MGSAYAALPPVTLSTRCTINGFQKKTEDPDSFFKLLQILVGLFDAIRSQPDPNLHLQFELRRSLHNIISFVGRHGLKLSSTPFNPKRYKDALEREACDAECLSHRRLIVSMGLHSAFWYTRRFFNPKLLPYDNKSFDFHHLDEHRASTLGV